jgi:hypothetical protein
MDVVFADFNSDGKTKLFFCVIIGTGSALFDKAWSFTVFSEDNDLLETRSIWC